MGWGLLQRNLQEGIWGAIRIKNAHPFGTDTLIRVYFAFHGHIFRICECMSCRWFLAQSSSKAQEEQNNISKACIRSDFWQQNLVPLETNSVAQHPTLNYLKTNLIGRFWSMCDFSRKQDKSVVNSWERLYKSIVTLRGLASLSLVCLTWTLFLPFSHKIGKERDCSQYAVPQNYINYV